MTIAKECEITLKNHYVRDHILLLTIILVLQICLSVSLGGFIVYHSLSIPQPIIFQATANKQIIAAAPLDAPSMNSAAILNWAVEAVRVMYSFNYHSIEMHPARISPYFDKRGLDRFFTIMDEDPNLKLVKSDKLIVSIKAIEAPKIITEGKIDGRYAWRISLPMAIRYESALIARHQEIKIDLYVWRVPETEAPIGVKITNLNLEVKQAYKFQGNPAAALMK